MRRSPPHSSNIIHRPVDTLLSSGYLPSSLSPPFILPCGVTNIPHFRFSAISQLCPKKSTVVETYSIQSKEQVVNSLSLRLNERSLEAGALEPRSIDTSAPWRTVVIISILTAITFRVTH